MAKPKPDAPRYAPPKPAPNNGDEVNYIHPGDGTKVTPALVRFVHEGLDGRVVNLALPTAEGEEAIVGVAYYPAPFTPEGADEPEQPAGHSWHWPKKKKSED